MLMKMMGLLVGFGIVGCGRSVPPCIGRGGLRRSRVYGVGGAMGRGMERGKKMERVKGRRAWVGLVLLLGLELGRGLL